MDICYFLGNDIFTSHVPCNPNWGDGTNDGVKRYINELTFETNRMLGEQNMKLTWKGPFERHDSRTSAAPSNPSHDVQSGKVSKKKYWKLPIRGWRGSASVDFPSAKNT